MTQSPTVEESNRNPTDSVPVQTWLRCSVGPGQFPDEYAVGGEKFDGRPFSLFAPRPTVQPPKQSPAGDGLLRVRVCERKGDLVLVKLPSQTFENGYFITVRTHQLVDEPGTAGPPG